MLDVFSNFLEKARKSAYPGGVGVNLGETIRSAGDEVAGSTEDFETSIVAVLGRPRTMAEAADFIGSYTSLKISEYTRRIYFEDVGGRVCEIRSFLSDIENFVRENDLGEDKILSLSEKLLKLCGEPFIECETGTFSINELDHDPGCRALAIRAESLEILLDAKACGQVGLERNIPPDVRNLGKGTYNVVQLAHTRPGIGDGNASGPIALKPCDQSKSEKNPDKFTHGANMFREHIGRASGNYGRNLAASGVQDMLCNIGKGKGITVPHVIASVSAAEISGVPCIAMEALEGETVEIATYNDQISPYNNEFIRRETWIQIQDVLTGQIDRHCNNVMLTADGPVAVDHDLSFPTNPPREFAGTVPLNITKSRWAWWNIVIEQAIDGKSHRNYCMPPFIDEDMYNVITNINLDELEGMYQRCGLTRLEISAAMDRAQVLINIARNLRNNRKVIAPNEWRDSQRVKDSCNETNLYAIRHLRAK
jgi:hypothetical protein